MKISVRDLLAAFAWGVAFSSLSQLLLDLSTKQYWTMFGIAIFSDGLYRIIKEKNA